MDRNLEVKLDELVNPNKKVSDYRTEITGVSAEDLAGVTCTLADIQVLWLFIGLKEYIFNIFSAQFLVHL